MLSYVNGLQLNGDTRTQTGEGIAECRLMYVTLSQGLMYEISWYLVLSSFFDVNTVGNETHIVLRHLCPPRQLCCMPAYR